MLGVVTGDLVCLGDSKFMEGAGVEGGRGRQGCRSCGRPAEASIPGGVCGAQKRVRSVEQPSVPSAGEGRAEASFQLDLRSLQWLVRTPRGGRSGGGAGRLDWRMG